MGRIFGDKGFRQSIGEDKENLQVSSELPKALSVRPEQAEIVTAVQVYLKPVKKRCSKSGKAPEIKHSTSDGDVLCSAIGGSLEFRKEYR